MKPQRKCQFKGHQGIEGTGCQYICTFNDCKLENRWVCSECLLEQLHHHGKQKQDHIMKQQQFLKYVIGIQEKCKENSQNQHLQDSLKQIEQLIQTTVMLKNQILSQIDYYNQQNNDLEDFIIKAKYDFYKLEHSQIQQIMVMTIKNYDFKQYNELSREICSQVDILNKNIEKNEQSAPLCILKPYQQDQQQIQQIKSIQQKYIDDYHSDEDCYDMQNAEKPCNDINKELEKQVKEEVNKKQHQVIKQTESEKMINQQNVLTTKYEYAEYFKYKLNIRIQISQISQNGKYLVIGTFDKKLLLFDLNTKTYIVEFQSYNNNCVNICRFTSDQKYLLCCDDKGILSQYDISKNFKFINANKIHQNIINDMVLVDNHIIITCSTDKSIQVRNIQSKQQIRIIENAHNDIINSIDFDYENDVIFSCSKDNLIILFKQSSGKMLFQEQANIYIWNEIQIIKLISNNRLIGSSNQKLILWEVNYNKKTLEYIKNFDELNYNFTTVMDNTNFALICQNTVKILDNDLDLITYIKHNVKVLSSYQRTFQQNQMNYILIIGEHDIQILKGREQHLRDKK